MPRNTGRGSTWGGKFPIGATDDPRTYRPVPVPGKAAREAAVEAVARDVMPCPRCASPDPGRCERTSCPQTEHDHRWTPWRRVVSTFAYDGTEVGMSIAELNRTPVTAGWSRNCSCGRIESSTGDLAALSAAPGQEPAHEWAFPSCGATTRARMADQDDDHGDCFEVCQGHPR